MWTNLNPIVRSLAVILLIDEGASQFASDFCSKQTPDLHAVQISKQWIYPREKTIV